MHPWPAAEPAAGHCEIEMAGSSSKAPKLCCWVDAGVKRMILMVSDAMVAGAARTKLGSHELPQAVGVALCAFLYAVSSLNNHKPAAHPKQSINTLHNHLQVITDAV